MPVPAIVEALATAVELGRSAPMPGSGRTLERWRMLSTLAAEDLTPARVCEAHLDALAILDEVDVSAAEPLMGSLRELLGVSDRSSWGVFAAEAAGVRLDATKADHGWEISGTKPWCSLAGDLSHALITAQTESGRRLFALALTHPGVRVQRGAWISRGLADVTSGPITLDAVPAVPVGEPQWYLERSGFAWGGLGVAACWYGGAVGLARSYLRQLSRRPPDQIALMHLGAIDSTLHGVRAALTEAAEMIDRGLAGGSAGAQLALRVRGLTASAVDDVLLRVGHSSGPAPLALDEEHARRVADLTVYVRQHHAERDQAAQGSMLMAEGGTAVDQAFAL